MTTTILILLALVALGTPALGSRLPYIIGGNDVNDDTKYPWQGSVRSDGSHVCGCVLISTTWAVTSAHCIGSITNSYTVKFGSTSRTSGGTVVEVSKIITHEDYGSGPGSFPNDIAVLRFSPFITGPTMNPIDIILSDPAGNDDCYITGWGYTRTGEGPVGLLADQLQEAKINVYTNTKCRGWWGSSINDGHICIGDSTNGRGSCNGDSGGPLVCKVGKYYELVGVTSWGVSGCNTNYPSVLTRLTYFRDWIRDKTGV